MYTSYKKDDKEAVGVPTLICGTSSKVGRMILGGFLLIGETGVGYSYTP
jgi:hypothetical protein